MHASEISPSKLHFYEGSEPHLIHGSLGQLDAASQMALDRFSRFWATVCKTIRPMLSDRCLPVLSVCDVDVLWPNGWMD